MFHKPSEEEHLLRPFQRIFQLFGKKAFLSNLLGKRNSTGTLPVWQGHSAQDPQGSIVTQPYWTALAEPEKQTHKQGNKPWIRLCLESYLQWLTWQLSEKKKSWRVTMPPLPSILPLIYLLGLPPHHLKEQTLSYRPPSLDAHLS